MWKYEKGIYTKELVYMRQLELHRKGYFTHMYRGHRGYVIRYWVQS